MRDEGRPLEVAIQVETSNHLKLLRSKAVVVSVEGKGRITCQVSVAEMNASEPLLRCRKRMDVIKTRDHHYPGIRQKGT